MKMTNWLVVMFMAGMLALVGCSKAPPPQETVDVNGVKVAMPALQKALSASTDKDIQNNLGTMVFGLRYRDYAGVQSSLAKLAANPSLSEEQKKLVAQVDDQLKQALAKGTPAPAP